MNNIILSFIGEPLVIIGIVCFIGLVIQKKPFMNIISGTVMALMGYTLIVFGSRMIIESISVFAPMFQNAFKIFGIIPNNDSMMAIIQINYSYETSIVMFVGFIFNILLARFTRFKYIFLNGYYVLYMASLIAYILTIQMGSNLTILFIGGAFLGLLMTASPALARPFTKVIFGNKLVTIGYFGIAGNIISGYIGKIFFARSAELKSSTTLDKRKSVHLFSDTNIIITLFMMILFATTALLTNRNIIYDMSNNTNFFIFAIKYSLIFSAGLYVIIHGVRMFTEQLVYSFKGISEKLVPNAIPALDASILFPYNPQLVIIGFFSSLVGGFVSVPLLMLLNLPVVIPGIAVHFFSGATSAFFGHAYGGKMGAIIGSFVQGVILSFIPILSIIIFNELGISRTSFADTDFGLIGILLKSLSQFLN